MKSNKKLIINLILSIGLMSVLIGFSFAYFTVNNDNSNNQKISIENGTMELTYTDCINSKDCSDISAELEPGDSISKTFSVKNTGTLDTSFKIIFSKSSNTFVDNELVYFLYNNDNNEEVTNGTIPYGDKKDVYIYTEAIKVGETKKYKLTITFKDITDGNNESNKDGTFNINLGITSTNNIAAMKIINDNGGIDTIKAKPVPDLSKSAVSQSYYDKLQDTCDGTTEWCEAKDRAVVENGLYAKADDYGTSYFFRGGDVNNNIIFGNFCWKIIRINGDGSIRIIYNGIPTGDGKTCTTQTGDSTQIGYSQFNLARDDNANLGYMYGLINATSYDDTVKNVNNSTIKTYIDNWYTTHLSNNFDKYISDEIFCNDRQISPSIQKSSVYSQLGYGKERTLYATYSRRYGTYRNASTDEEKLGHFNSMSLKCTQKNDRFTVSDTMLGNGDLTYPVGLITMDEVVLAGGGTAFKSWSATEYRINNSFYLYTGKTYWTISPNDLDTGNNTNVFAVHSGGYIHRHWTTFENGVRPVINLNSNIKINDGDGSMLKPYTIVY